MSLIDRQELREMVLKVWDPVGVFDESEGPEYRRAIEDEYDDYLPEIETALVQSLAPGPLEERSRPVAETLASIRNACMSKRPQPDADARAAELLVRWAARSIRT